MIAPGTVLLHDNRSEGGRSLLFARPVEILEAFTKTRALAALGRIEAARGEGLWAAGYFAYELGFAFEERLGAFLFEPSATPLLWLGLYDEPRQFDSNEARRFIEDAAGGGSVRVADLRCGIDFAAYERAFNAIKAYVEAGDAYQVNLTFKARFRLEGDPMALYRDLAVSQPVAFGALIAAGDTTILSRSPELFVENRRGLLAMRPMKGTLARGRTLDEDEAGRHALRNDPKNRAENLMIVDLLRNDLGRIAEIGSVSVADLYSVETFRSLHQLTSGITARLRPGLTIADILRAVFPSGSITGAPKIRAMEIIEELEAGPRGPYTGAIGYLAPSGDFSFSVAIRTAVIGPDGMGEIGVGGGIVADSELKSEYEEALLKLKFFTDPAPPVALIETLLWKEETGFWLLERHLARLAASARYFGIPLADGAAAAALSGAATRFGEAPMRVRLLLDEVDGLSVTATPLPAGPPAEVKFMLASEPVDSADPRLFHKTTNRAFLDESRKRAAERHGVDEVVFLNQRGELTEGSIMSLFVSQNGTLMTPALSCGLLPGTLRAELLTTGEAREAVLRPADLAGAEGIFLGNSVRGLVPARQVDPASSRATKP